MRVEGSPRPLTPALELTAYRIIQEGLTNALKHAPGARTEVVLGYADDELRIDVSNHGRGPGPETSAHVNGSGRGLLGMQQRVAVYGGRLEVGPQPDGGFAVRARLPVPAA
jgi:signal transduction histidine kinase